MGDVTAVMMDVITEKSGHSVTPMAVSVCITPAAPSPLPIPYPVMASSVEGIGDSPMRTKINGAPIATVGSVLKTCHGNEPGTLKEVVSLNTAGPVFLVMGAPVVLCELGMMGITGSMCVSNKAPTPGAGGSASDAGGTGGAGGGGGGGGSAGGDASNTTGPQGGGGSGGGGSTSGASASSASPSSVSAEERELAARPGNTPEQRAAREKVGRDFYEQNCPEMSQADIDSHVRCIDATRPVDVVRIPPQGGGPNGDQLYQHSFPGGRPGQYFAQDTTTTADQLGANPRVLVPGSGDTPPRIVPREQRSFTADPASPAVGLRSTAAPANDTWSQSGQPRQCGGGGTQIMVPRSNQGGLR